MSLADVGDIIVKLQRLVAQKAVDEIEAYLSPEHKTVPGTESKSNVATGIPVDGGPVGSDLLLGRSMQAPDPDRQPLPMEEGGGVDEMQLQDEDDGDYPLRTGLFPSPLFYSHGRRRKLCEDFPIFRKVSFPRP